MGSNGLLEYETYPQLSGW